MGYSRPLMQRWIGDSDGDALAILLRLGAVRSASRRLGGVVGNYGEYLAARALDGTRLRQADPRGDLLRPDDARPVEVKATIGRTGFPDLRYRHADKDYVLIRFDPVTWAVVEAWLVPLAVARGHGRGWRFRLPASGTWRTECEPLRHRLARF